MIYLIGQLSVWLILTAAFAGLAGWALAAGRAAPEQRALQRERDNLLSDIARLAGGGGGDDATAVERESDAMRRLIEVRDGRIAELEHALSASRARTDESESRLAETARSLPAPAENEELLRLRALVAQHEEDRSREVEVTAQPVEQDDSVALQSWRLRYFEQRVRYLEGLAAAGSQATTQAAAEVPVQPITEWRAREAEARAAHLEQELRTVAASPTAASEPAPEATPFASDAGVDVLLRWRLLYLERRVAYLQEEAARAAPPPAAQPVSATGAEAGPDPDRWKWRARYLEARVRHLEQQPVRSVAAQPIVAPAAEEAASPPPRPAVRGEKPPVLPAARNGAPDDFTLIEDVSVLQQTTLYSIGVFHFDQIADWTPPNVAWVDQYLRLRGRIDDEEWVEQARALAQGGVSASRRMVDAEA